MYGTSPEKVSRQVSAAVQGVPTTSMRLADFLDIPIRVQYGRPDRNSLSALEHAYVGSDFGPIPLRALAAVETHTQRPFITREDLQATIDVTGVNFDMTIAQVSGIDPPGGYSIEFAGTASDMESTQKQLGQALVIGSISGPARLRNDWPDRGGPDRLYALLRYLRTDQRASGDHKNLARGHVFSRRAARYCGRGFCICQATPP
jgi:hypothetical protein